MARLTLILGVLATVIYLLDGFRFMLNEWRRWKNRSKWIGPLVVLCCIPSVTTATVYNAASCSRADVGTAVALAVHGDTVNIPACAQTDWTTQLTITQGITLNGAGEGVTIIGDNVTKDGSATSKLIEFNVTTPNTFTISNFTIVGVALDPSVFNKGHIGLAGTATGFRVHHLTVTNATDASIVFLGGALTGLIDHLTTTANFKQVIIINHANWAGGIYADGSWAEPLTWGTANAIYIEDSSFTDVSAVGTLGAIDCLGGGRYVARYNISVDKPISGSHGTDSGQRTRGCRQIEAYENATTYTRAFDRAQQTRGGTSVVYNNEVTTSSSVNSFVLAANFRDDANYIPWGWCQERDITSITRSGTTATVTTSASHGKASGGAVRIIGANQAEYNLSTTISNVTATTFDYTVSGSPATPATGTLVWASPYDENQAGQTGYRCVDQPGAGTSNDLAGSGSSGGVTPPSPYQFVGNIVDPIYVWGNTINAASNNTVSASRNVVSGRDYFNDGTQRPGYTAYTYPHPLQGGSQPSVIARVFRWMSWMGTVSATAWFGALECLSLMLGLGFHVRRPLTRLAVAGVQSGGVLFRSAPTMMNQTKQGGRSVAIKALTVFNDITKPRA